MVDILSKIVLVTDLLEALNNLGKLIATKRINKKEKVLIAEALIAIQTATIQTQKFIDSSGYLPNDELTTLWQEAFRKATIARIQGLASYLYTKAEFWGNPTEWLSNPEKLKFVPTLTELREKCDDLLKKLH